MDVFVHGGAGAARDEDGHEMALQEAANAGTGVDDPVAAVVEALAVLEADPRFNAGVGSAVQSDGRIRTDAGIMRGDGTVGAACSMEGVEHAIGVADAVRTETPHVLLAGDRAEAFADTVGIDTTANLWTERTRERWAEEHLADAGYAEQLASVRERFGTGHDTVGAVATDGEQVAAGTSTGGRWLALARRVGDVPQVGSGFYASPHGAVSTTGAGEGIARVTLARLTERHLAAGAEPDTTAADALETFEARAAGTAGLIVMAPDGTTGSAYSSEAMPTAVAHS